MSVRDERAGCDYGLAKQIITLRRLTKMLRQREKDEQTIKYQRLILRDRLAVFDHAVCVCVHT